jgi:hypothetical protein
MGQGATAAQNQIGGSQQNFMSTLQSDFGTAFSGQQNIISGLTKSLQSTLSAGPSQFGFSAPQTTALNTLATTQNALAAKQARIAAAEAGAAAGGGANLPSGSQSGIQAKIAEDAANQQSNSLLGIQEAGYKQGAENYQNSVKGLEEMANLENPNGLAGSANTSGAEAASTAATIQKENQAASPWAQVGGLVGSLAGAAVGMIPGASSLKGTITPGQQSADVSQGYSNAAGMDTGDYTNLGTIPTQ